MRKECELTSTVKLPAEAESYRVQVIAEGKRTQTLEAARAEAERIRKIGGAEALAIELVSLDFIPIDCAESFISHLSFLKVGKAEAERMRMKAAVYKQYGDAAIMNIVLESLPKVSTIKSSFVVIECSIKNLFALFRLLPKLPLHWPRRKKL